MGKGAMDNDLLSKYGGPVPRYTSYPTAPHFHDGIGGGTCTHVGTLVALLASWVWHCNHVVVAN